MLETQSSCKVSSGPFNLCSISLQGIWYVKGQSESWDFIRVGGRKWLVSRTSGIMGQGCSKASASQMSGEGLPGYKLEPVEACKRAVAGIGCCQKGKELTPSMGNEGYSQSEMEDQWGPSHGERENMVAKASHPQPCTHFLQGNSPTPELQPAWAWPRGAANGGHWHLITLEPGSGERGAKCRSTVLSHGFLLPRDTWRWGPEGPSAASAWIPWSRGCSTF